MEIERTDMTPGWPADAVLEDSPTLAVRAVRGRGPRLVISFRGTGTARSGGRPEEFWGTISEGGANHLLFVADRTNGWYNHRGMIRAIDAHIAATIEALAPRQIFMIGNSMGGYGACLFAARHPVDAVIAICPQASLDPAVVPDPRYRRLARAVRTFRAPPLGACLRDRTRYWLMNGARGWDRLQAAMVPLRGNLRHFLFPGHFHAVAEMLKARKALRPIVSAILDGADMEAERRIVAEGGRLRRAEGTA